MKKPESSSPARVALVYVVFGLLWILLSDNALELILQDDLQKYSLYQTLKGWLFVLLSALLIYTLQRRDMRALAESARQYKVLFADNPQPMWVYDVETLRFLAVNDAAVHVYGYTREEFLGMTIKDIRPAEDIPALLNSVAARETLQRSGGWRHIKKDGTLIDVEITSHSTQFNGRSARLVLAHDVTERKHAETRILQLNRLYDALSHINQTIIHAQEPQRLFEEICRVAVEHGRYRMAWIGLIEPESLMVQPAAFAGQETNYLTNLIIHARDDTEWGWGPTGTAIREGHSIVCDDITTDPLMAPWREQALACGFRSSASVPIRRYGLVIGALNVYAAEPFAFGGDDENLLNEMSGNISFALDTMENEARRRQAEAQLRESEERFRLMAENIEEGFWITDPINQKEIYLSNANERIWGRSIADLTKEWGAFLESVLPEDRPLVLENMAKQLRGEQTSMEYRILRPDGSLRWLWYRAFPLLNDSGNVDIVTGLVTDITERKQTEMEIQKQIKRMSVLSAIDRMINSSIDLTLTMNVFLMEITAQLEVDAARILLYNPHLQVLEPVMRRGFLTHRESLPQRLGEGLAGRAALNRREVIIPNLGDLEDSPEYITAYAGEGFVSYFGIPLIAKGQVKGVLEIFHRAELSPNQDWFDYMMTLAGQAAIAIDNIQLFENLQNSNYELMMAYDATIAGWSRAMDLRDKETEGHTRRVTEMTLQLAERMGVSQQDLIHVKRGALLHDIGKLGVPDQILLKPGALTDEEWAQMRAHPTHAYHMLLPIEYLRPALDIPYCHHEKWDGSGYPRGLKGEEIPFAARIFAVVDVWDALRSDRPYRAGWSAEKTRDYIQAESGRHFDPHVVDAFLKLLEDHPEFM